MASLEQLETWIAPMLQKLRPAERTRLARSIGTDMRRSQSQRIARQENPDGSPYQPRKTAGSGRKKRGRIKRRAMFAKIRTAKHLKITTDASGVAVGFVGRVARIAGVHQTGAAEAVKPGGKSVRYPRRELLGFTDADIARIREQLLDFLTG